ncbi:flavin reductase family protein [Candidatus Bipolaricaulota bacterium]|nr:flavin reductase family protein [Candidatus Bipolaricaulota bacterium]
MSAAVLDTSDEQRPEWLIPSGVFIVTLRSGNRINAYAAGWVVRVSEEPVMIQVAVWDQNYSHELAQDCDHFVVQILEEGQQKIARHFGKNSGRNMDKFSAFQTHTGLAGLPILEDCLAYLECEVIFRKQFGDHMILVGKAGNSGINRFGTPLIYNHQDYQD